MKTTFVLASVEKFLTEDSFKGQDWRDWGACIGEDPELFFSFSHGAFNRQQTKTAKSICARCPVQLKCLTWAIDSGAEYGIWGGKSEDERAVMIRNRSGVTK